MPNLCAPGCFHGAVARRRELAGFTLTETHYPGEGALPPHRHEHGRIELVLRGSYRETVAERVTERDTMTLSLHPPGETHAREFGTGTLRLFNLEFGPEWLARARRLWGLSVPPVDVRSGALPALARRVHREFERDDRVSLAAVEGLLIHALSTAAAAWDPPERGTPAWLDTVVELIHSRFQHPLSVSALAACGGVRRQTLGRVFRRVHGCGLREYVMRVRVDYACRQLADTDQPLADLSAAAGFCDQSHFSAVFRRITGSTPSAWRENRRLRRREGEGAFPPSPSALRLHSVPGLDRRPIPDVASGDAPVMSPSASFPRAARDTTG